MEGYPAEEHGATVREITNVRGCIYKFTRDNTEIERLKELVAKADIALGDIVSNGGLLNKEQVDKFLAFYSEEEDDEKNAEV